MTISSYNPDKRYEMMSAILPGENQPIPDAEQVIEDLQQILKLCYAFTTDAGTPKERTASDLGEAIVTYLFATWTGIEVDFEPYSKEYWAKPEEPQLDE